MKVLPVFKAAWKAAQLPTPLKKEHKDIRPTLM